MIRIIMNRNMSNTFTEVENFKTAVSLILDRYHGALLNKFLLLHRIEARFHTLHGDHNWVSQCGG